jgi:hypothetical protein
MRFAGLAASAPATRPAYPTPGPATQPAIRPARPPSGCLSIDFKLTST